MATYITPEKFFSDPEYCREKYGEAFAEVKRLKKANSALKAQAQQAKWDKASALSEVIRMRRMVEMYEEENQVLKKKVADREKSIKGYRRWHEVYRRELAKMEAQ